MPIAACNYFYNTLVQRKRSRIQEESEIGEEEKQIENHVAFHPMHRFFMASAVIRYIGL